MSDDPLSRLRARVADGMARTREDLERLVRIPSVGAPGFDPGPVRASAVLVRDLLAGAGMEARLLELEGANPAVLATLPARQGAPTVLLYAHHDVQPAGPEVRWATPPFEPAERGGRLYGRGSADDKAGIAVHLAAVRAFEGRPPVGLVVLVEGEEESGSPNLAGFLERYGGLMRADVVVLADSGNWRVGQPALTTSLRGLVDCTIEVRTADHAVHSGMYGGPVPDALTVLCRTLASLHDERGNVAVPGLASGPADPLDLTEEELRREAGLLPGVRLLGEGGLTERLWTRPAVSVLAIDAPRVAEASNTLIPSARALVSLRLAPGEDPERALTALKAHLEASVPWGAEVTVADGTTGAPYRVEAEGPAYDAVRRAFAEAWGVAPVDIGAGGSIPFLAAFAERFPGTALLLTGVEDPASNAHAENESVHLGDLERACLAETLFLAHLAEIS